MTILNAEIRKKGDATEELRKGGMIPAVFYGPKEETTSIAIKKIDFLKAWEEAGETTTITLKTKEKAIDVLIQDIQRDPITSTPIHADFYALDMKKEVEVPVPVEFVGVAPVVKSGLGTIVKVLHEITVTALPKDLPHEIIVDISSLKTVDDNISIKDIKLPSGVTAVNKPDDIVVSVATQKEEKEDEISTEDALASIEVEKKGKEEKEEEGK